jgi:NADH dehydrogenase
MSMDIVVLGGGFAGIAAVDELCQLRKAGCELRARLVDRQSHSVFAPLLPDLISKRVLPEHVCYPLEAHCRKRGAEFLQSEVRSIDPDRCTVETDGGSLHGDALIVCLGCETNYFGNDAFRSHCPGLKTVEEAGQIREGVLRLWREAEDAGQPAHLLVVGGGYTGFETASHVAYLLHQATGRPYHRLGEVCRVIILELADEVLRNCSPRVREWAGNVIRDFGVEVRTNLTVEEVSSQDRAKLSDGTVLDRAMAVWTPGVTPGEAAASMGARRAVGGRLEVDTCLRVGDKKRVFGAGDVAGALPPNADSVLRMGVQFSIAGGKHAARNAVLAAGGNAPMTFAPFDPGYILPLAPGKASGKIMGNELSGRLPYLMHMSLCVARSWGMHNRWSVLEDVCRSSCTGQAG